MNIPATINLHTTSPSLRQNGQGQNLNRERPNTEDSRQQTLPGNRKPPSDYVFRGELLDAVDQQQRFRPGFNQQVSPQNRLAIESYLSSDSISIDEDRRGRLLDQFV